MNKQLASIFLLLMLISPIFLMMPTLPRVHAYDEMFSERFADPFSDENGPNGEKISWNSSYWHDGSGSARVYLSAEPPVARQFRKDIWNMTAYDSYNVITISFWFMFESWLYNTTTNVVNFGGLYTASQLAASFRYWPGQNRIDGLVRDGAYSYVPISFNSTSINAHKWYSADIVYSPLNDTVVAMYFDAKPGATPSSYSWPISAHNGGHLNYFAIGDLSNGNDYSDVNRPTSECVFFIDDIVAYSDHAISAGSGGISSGAQTQIIAKAEFSETFETTVTANNEIMMYSAGRVRVNTTDPAVSRQFNWIVMPLKTYEKFEELTLTFDVTFTNMTNEANHIINYAGYYSGDQEATWRVDANTSETSNLMKDNTVGSFSTTISLGTEYTGYMVINMTSGNMTAMRFNGNDASAGIPYNVTALAMQNFRIGDLTNGVDALGAHTPECVYYIDNIYVYASVNAVEIVEDVTVEIPDLDFDPIMFVDRFYTVVQTVSVNDNIDTMRVRFNDGYTYVYLTYDNITDLFSIETTRLVDAATVADYAVLDTGHSSTSKTLVNTTRTIEATYRMKLTIRMQDALSVDLYYWYNTTAGSSSGWILAQNNYFDIYNHGGWIEWAASGDGGRITGGDAFEMWGRNGSSVEVNQTWHHLEHYHAQFSIRHSENGTGEDNYWQDNGHIVPGEKWSDKGDWQLEIGWFYFDPVDKVYVEGCNGLIMMEEGDVGTDDLWVNLNVTWSDATGSVAGSEIMTAFVEREDESKVRLWTDVWFNKMNASTVLGCRVSSYYYGIVNTANWLWPNWRPLIENSSESMNFGRTLDNDGDITPSQFLELVKVSFNLTRPSYNNTSPNENFMTEIRDFDISEFNLALSDIVDGVNTPIFVDTKVPDLPVNSFLAPIYAALMMIGDTIMGALAYAQEWVWNGIRERWPWFTDFWENSLETIYSLGEIFTIMWTHMTNLFSFLVDLFGYVTYPIQVIQNAWATVQAALTWIDGLNLRDLIVVVLLVLIFVPVIGAVTAGDWGYLFKMAQVTWRIIYALFDIFYRFVTFVINAILSLIPL